MSGDAGVDAPARATCTSDQDCADGVFCNGEEQCAPADTEANDLGCIEGPLACEGVCDEEADTCLVSCADADGDGEGDVACGGRDCDDNDPRRFVGNTEICDAENIDEDCDPRTVGFRDADMDGVNDSLCCNGETCGDDCDDMSPGVHHTAPEVCDNVDNDCDGMVDEGVQLSWYPDTDMDGFGDQTATPIVSCSPPPLHVLDGTDCDDSNRDVNPVAFDVCDGVIDHNCNGMLDDPPLGCSCTANQTQNCELPGVCAAATRTCLGGTWSGCTIGPSPEECDGQDDDCDGSVDESLPLLRMFPDADGDGFGETESGVDSCELEAGYVLDGRDCYDVPGAGSAVSPFITSYSETDRGDGSFDFNCDGDETQEFGLAEPCNPGSCVFRGPGWFLTIPPCGESGTLLTGCTREENKGGGCLRNLQNRVARCR